MKNLAVFIAIVFMLAGGYMMFTSTQKINRVQTDLESEMYSRMVAEENLQTANRKVRLLERELVDSKEKLESIQSILSKDKNKHAGLKEKLSEMTEAKEDLERRLNEVQQDQQYY